MTTTVNKKKNQMQKEAVESWLKTKRGSICIFTGGGKTKTGVDVINALQDEITSVLIVTPTTNLKNKEWPTELNRWRKISMNSKIKKVSITTRNKAYKLEEDYDLLILDEVHGTFSPEYVKIHSIPHKYKLGLTATPPKHNKEYMEKMEQLCPVVYIKTLEEGINEGIASPFQMYNMPVSLNRKERGKYTMWNKQFSSASYKLYDYKRTCNKLQIETPKSVFDMANEYQKKKDHPMRSVAKQYWAAMTMRKWILYKSENKIYRISEIIRKIDSAQKWIIFSKSTKFVDKVVEKLNKDGVSAVGYHSKMSKEDKTKALSDFGKDRYKVLVSADALNQGYNLPSIDAAICAAGTSVTLTLMQQLGRIVRRKEGKQALFVNLYAKSTQEEKWLDNKTKDIDTKEVESVADLIHELNTRE